LNSFRAKLAACFLACMCIPLTMMYFGLRYYDTRDRYAAIGDLLDTSFRQLLHVYELEAGLLSFDQRNIVFFDSGESGLQVQHTQEMLSLRSNLGRLRQQLNAESIDLNDQITGIETDLGAYQKSFEELVMLLRQRGFQDFGMVGAMRDAVHQLESQVEMQQPAQMVHLLPRPIKNPDQ